MNPKPCRCLFYLNPVIPTRHFNPSSLLFLITNRQFAPISSSFQAELPPNGHRRPRLGSNNGSGAIRDPVAAKRDLAALGPLLLRGVRIRYEIYERIRMNIDIEIVCRARCNWFVNYAN